MNADTNVIRATHHPLRRRKATRVLVGAATVMALLLVSGALYQAIGARLDKAHDPPPGRLVDIGGYRLHINCTGPEDGSPPMILDHGGGGFGSLDFSVTQAELSKFALVCSYDRAGYGWSDPSPTPRTVSYETDELERLLERSGIAPPYVLVADSLGSYTDRLYATRHPERVAGLLFVDVSFEDEWSIPEIRDFNHKFGLMTAFCKAAGPIGLWRALGETGLFRHPVLGVLPESVRAQAQRLTYRPAYCSTIKEETAISSLEDSSATLRKTRVPLGDVPLVILTAGSGYPNDGVRDAWVRGQADLLTLSTRSEQHVIDGATHFNLAIDRVDIVASAARDLRARLGRGRQLGSRL